ncbi:helix-turn-helix domain-containing protein [Deinococcus sp.]|uniref:helix-turn-helix domain-containing protein n=1 Tax=Deinococcus sp. TaxID=47478 RepID=UPI0025FAB94F|nr:helix-turn-helix domain-containing protein [Deinococcus sp.]
MTQLLPLALLTIPEVAKLLHVSGDTVRRQIREGDLPAVRIGVTPAGRPRYRVPSQAVQSRLGEYSPHGEPVAADPLEALRAAFAELSPTEREHLLTEAIAWAKAQRPEVSLEGRAPEPSADDLRARFAKRRQRFEQ